MFGPSFIEHDQRFGVHEISEAWRIILSSFFRELISKGVAPLGENWNSKDQDVVGSFPINETQYYYTDFEFIYVSHYNENYKMYLIQQEITSSFFMYITRLKLCFQNLVLSERVNHRLDKQQLLRALLVYKSADAKVGWVTVQH